MNKRLDILSEAARKRRLSAMHLQEIEGNPLDAQQIALFEMFERKGWPHERCLAYLRDHAKALAAPALVLAE